MNDSNQEQLGNTQKKGPIQRLFSSLEDQKR